MERLRTKTRGFAYPVGESLAIVRRAGGLSKLSPEERDQVRFKDVAIGEWCDDMPEESIALRLERGEIERVTVDDGEIPSGPIVRRKRGTA